MLIKRGDRVKIKELDVVLLKDGREATVLELFDGGKAFLVEVTDGKGVTLDTPVILESDIVKVIYSA